MARWVNESYWAKDIEDEKAKEWKQWFWGEARSLALHSLKGILLVGGILGTVAGVFAWISWMVGDGEQFHWFRWATLIPVVGITIGFIRWWDEI